MTESETYTPNTAGYKEMISKLCDLFADYRPSIRDTSCIILGLLGNMISDLPEAGRAEVRNFIINNLDEMIRELPLPEEKIDS